ncbi:MAG TPA: NAD-dependent epimerase [Burkholderiales bacterium]|nr:NAD-dependent epimerase [Burkholderiales bacterium]
MTILVTGSAGFIGMHVAKRLLERGEQVVGLDNLNVYYDVRLKEARLRELDPFGQFHFIKADVADRAALERVFEDRPPKRVVHLAAQAGVRYSLKDPHAYVSSNLVGFVNLLEACRHARLEHLVYASTSSVYGANVSTPFREDDPVDHPVSLYAATKRSNELIAHTYSHLFGLPTTGLRFFTVYGPWGRPDMSMALFTKAILADEPITVFNYGQMRRDFTYIDDIVEGVVRVLALVPRSGPVDAPDAYARPSASAAPFRLYNIGNSQPVELLEYIRLIENATGQRAKLDLQPIQPGDVVATAADTSALEAAVGFRPATPLDQGIRRYVAWHRAYYGAPPAGKSGAAGR